MFSKQYHHHQVRNGSRLLGILLVLLLIYWPTSKVIERAQRCSRCELSIMTPNYVEISDKVKSKKSYKYRLFKYSDWNVPNRKDPAGTGGCIPTIFIPGSMGSYRQVRSIGSEILKATIDDKVCFEFYSVDFREELVAFSPNLITQQATYVNDAVNYISSSTINYYHAKVSMVMIGHSFGGVVLRTLPNLENFSLKGHHHVIHLYLSVPIKKPPLVTSKEFTNLYKSISDDTFIKVQSKELNYTVFQLNVASGASDILVPGHLSLSSSSREEEEQPNHLQHQSNPHWGIRVDQASDNWSDPNHQAIVWERGLLRRLSSFLRSIVSDFPPSSSSSSPKEEKDSQEITPDRNLFTNPQHIFTLSSNQLKCQNVHLKSKSLLTREDYCNLKGDEGYVCLVYNVEGNFQLFTTESLEDNLKGLYFGDGVEIFKDHIKITNPKSIAVRVEHFPGMVYNFKTVTNSKTTVTERATIIKGSYSGVSILQLSCHHHHHHHHHHQHQQPRKLYNKMSLPEWGNLIQNGTDEYFRIQNLSRTTTFLQSPNLLKPCQETLNFQTLLFKRSFECSEGELHFEFPNHDDDDGNRSIPLRLSVHSKYPKDYYFVWAEDALTGYRHYSESAGDFSTQTITIYPGTKIFGITFTDKGPHEIMLDWKLGETALLVFTGNFNAIISNFYFASLILNLNFTWFPCALFIWIGNSLSHSKGLNFTEMFTLGIISAWISAVLVAIRLTLLPKGSTKWSQRTLLLFCIMALLLLPMPIPDESKVTLSLLSILLLDILTLWGVRAQTLSLTLASITHILVTFAGIRNIMVLIQEIGLMQVLYQEITIDRSRLYPTIKFIIFLFSAFIPFKERRRLSFPLIFFLVILLLTLILLLVNEETFQLPFINSLNNVLGVFI